MNWRASPVRRRGDSRGPDAPHKRNREPASPVFVFRENDLPDTRWHMAPSFLLLIGALTSLGSTGTLVRLSVEVNGQIAPLYPGPNGRFYIEARRGANYSVRLENATPT